MIIAIDGTCCSGKSSACKQLSKRLGYAHLNTGLIYRAFAYQCLISKVMPPKKAEIIDLIINHNKTSLRMVNRELQIFYENRQLTAADLRSPEINAIVPFVAAISEIRSFARVIQRKLGEDCENIIVEGRDICSVVFPDADLKFFITADVDVRAQRNLNDYIKLGKSISFDEVKKEIIERDKSDTLREDSPLTKTDDSITIDTSNLSKEQVVDKLDEIVKKAQVKNEV